MKTTTKLSIRWLTTLPLLGLAAGISGPLACTGEFKTKCPDGTVQQGGGDVDEACVGAGAGGASGSAGAPAGGGSGGVGGEGGGQTPVCAAGATRCANDAQETCGEGGQWGPAKACEIACDAAGTACVVPVQVAAGGNSACALLSDGTVRCWGDNRSGELGNGTDAGSLKPTPVAGVSNAAKIVTAVGGACVINHDKSAACWGANHQGQFVPNVDGANNVLRAPVVLGLANVIDVALNERNLCVVTGTSGGSSVRCRGNNDAGQLGNGTVSPSNSFETVKGLPASIRTVGVGGGHACAVSEQGSTFCWGGGGQGQNGSPTLANVSEAIPVSGEASTGVLQISLGVIGSLAVRDDGAILAWGATAVAEPPKAGQAHLPRFVDIGVKGLGVSAPGSHGCFLGEGGSVWCAGYNPNGQAGVACPGAASCESEYVRKPSQLDVGWSAIQISAGGSGACALTNAGEIYCWGVNKDGQVGVGHVSEQEPPSKVVWK